MALVFWAIIGTVIATIGACVPGPLAFLFDTACESRPVARSSRLLRISLHVSEVGRSGVGFQAALNETFLYRDPGLGDRWRCLLPKWILDSDDR